MYNLPTYNVRLNALQIGYIMAMAKGAPKDDPVAAGIAESLLPTVKEIYNPTPNIRGDQ